jgi:hypothetical protein
MEGISPKPKKQGKPRGSRIPAVCPKCSRPMRKFRSASAVVHGAQVKKVQPAHFHLTFAGVCGGMHMHVCAACGARSRTTDPACAWQEPKTFEPGWTAAKASQCESEIDSATDATSEGDPN